MPTTHVVQLRKMSLLSGVRGHGRSKAPLARCLDAARSFAFATRYLETLVSRETARRRTLPIAESGSLSPAIVAYVLHTCESAILNDASREGTLTTVHRL
jgi:hypothetical protein